MQRLFQFIYVYRAFFTFLLLELLSAWLLIANDRYQSALFFNSSNRISAGILGFSRSTSEYFGLRKINDELARENAQLRSLLEQRKMIPVKESAFDYVGAKVINNSVSQFKNFITIDQGEASGILPGMAVISHDGAIGKVKAVSDHYAVVISLLNIDEQVSCVLKRTGSFGTAQWDGTDPRMVNMLYVPRHVQPQAGDTIVTSGYNAVFPPGVMIGLVKDVKLKEEALFYDIRVELAQDFTRLSFVHVVRSHHKPEIDSLQIKTTGINP